MSTLGSSKGVALSPDLGHVVTTIRMNRDAAPLLAEGTRFWVVKPRLFAGNLSGLGTLLSGSYIGDCLPGGGWCRGKPASSALRTRHSCGAREAWAHVPPAG